MSDGTLIVTQAEVPALLPMADCIDAMAEVFRALAQGQTLQPLRSFLFLPERRDLLGMMPGYVADPPALGIKVITVFPSNHGSAYDAHQGAILLFEPEHGALRAMVDATSVTAIRTAAVSALATRLLARDDAGDLAVIGTGVQARTHLEAMAAVRPLHRVRAWSRAPAHVAAFIAFARERGFDAEAADSAEACVRGADLVCTVTSSTEPVLHGEWLAPGAHVNAVGSSQKHARELDSDAVARSRLYVDRRESTLAEAGDFLVPESEGLIGKEHIVGEIGELLLGRVPGRRSADEITLFKSLGLAVEDVAAVHHIYARAQKSGAGRWIEFGGRRS
jgi:ornithine cyclodeaminase/alanine dehydrogenase-like protein (mu-crystallin family)